MNRTTKKVQYHNSCGFDLSSINSSRFVFHLCSAYGCGPGSGPRPSCQSLNFLSHSRSTIGSFFTDCFSGSGSAGGGLATGYTSSPLGSPNPGHSPGVSSSDSSRSSFSYSSSFLGGSSFFSSGSSYLILFFIFFGLGFFPPTSKSPLFWPVRHDLPIKDFFF